jgi:hypothetical protein
VIFSKQKRAERKALKAEQAAEKAALDAAHIECLALAQAVYDEHKGETIVINGGSFPGGMYVTGASPSREAWDEYFYAMQDRGFSGWKTQARFDKELKL